MARRRKPRSKHSPAEYFVAALGVVMILGVVALAVTPRSCHLETAPGFGLKPGQPTPTPVGPTP